jgi:tetratricopeptide (TPR) repeat protein
MQDAGASPMTGQVVAFTGKLASLTLGEARDLVRACGGEWESRVTAQTTLLVVGQDGLPLGKDGRPSKRLRAARRLAAASIVNEADWLASLSTAAPFIATSGQSTAQLCQLLAVSGQRLRQWVKLGLIQPTASILGVHFFDFRQVSRARTLTKLMGAGVSPARIRHSLEQLGQWLPAGDQALSQLALLDSDGQLSIRLETGLLTDPSGQGLLDYRDTGTATTLSNEVPGPTADASFHEGCAREDAGRHEEAAAAYRRALTVGGPEAITCFNLANVLYSLGAKDQALERFYQALELDPTLAGAWMNVGNLLAERGQQAEAMAAYLKVLALEPTNADGHYNLADLLDEMGRPAEALPHWRAYLKADPSSPWASHARLRLGRAR